MSSSSSSTHTIAIIGPGNVGSALGILFAKLGHKVIFATRDPKSEKVQQLLSKAPGTTAATAPHAVKEADIVVVATPWNVTQEAIQNAGDLSGKILIDATNPIGPNFTLLVGTSSSGGEEVAKWASGAKVVKCFNTIGCDLFSEPNINGQKADMYIAGDDSDAKKVVASLVEQLGFEPINVGPLSAARFTEPLAMVWITLAYREGWGRSHAFKLVRK